MYLNMGRKNFEILRDFAVQLGLLNWYPTKNRRQVVFPTACVVMQNELTATDHRSANNGEYAIQCQDTTKLELRLMGTNKNHYRILNDELLTHPDYLILQLDYEKVFIKDHKVPLADFEQTLWREYLQLSDMVSMAPVLYPTLRNQVCAKLCITDQTFDYQLKVLIREPQRLNIHPSDGTLNYAANLAHISKLLPPQTSEGNFIVYLKIERRNIT